MKLKSLEEGVDFFLRLSECVRYGLGSNNLMYAGMPSEQAFALVKSEFDGRTYTLYFPATLGTISIHDPISEILEAKFDVRNITPQRITLRYLGTCLKK